MDWFDLTALELGAKIQAGEVSAAGAFLATDQMNQLLVEFVQHSYSAITLFSEHNRGMAI